MTTDKEFCDLIHLEIHAVRRIAGYKPSIMESNVSKFVIEHFKDCKECQDVKDKLKSQPKKQGFLKRIGEILDE